MSTVIAVAALVLVLFLAIRYIVKQKRSGAVCIGCPNAGGCSKTSAAKASGCSCGCGSDQSGR